MSFALVVGWLALVGLVVNAVAGTLAWAAWLVADWLAGWRHSGDRE